MWLFKSQFEHEKMLGVLVDSVTTHNDITPQEKLTNKNFFNSFGGSLLIMSLWLSCGALCLHVFTDINIHDPDACNLMQGFPKVSEVGFSLWAITTATNIIYSLQNPQTLVPFSFQLEFWLITANTLILASIGISIWVLANMMSFTLWTEMGMNDHSCSIIVSVIVTNIILICFVPALYSFFVYDKRSVVTDETRAKFMLAKLQPFAISRLAEFAHDEMETDSVLLYQTIRAICKNQANVLDNKFDCNIRLANLIYEKYIQKEWKTLVWYDLEKLVVDVKSAQDLLEKDSLLEGLEKEVQKKIILPMFARMIYHNRDKIAF
jgi:hypothetical protein